MQEGEQREAGICARLSHAGVRRCSLNVSADLYADFFVISRSRFFAELFYATLVYREFFADESMRAYGARLLSDMQSCP